jgi:AI-2E family transporter
MPDQVKNKSTVAGQDQQRVIEIALPSSISTSDRLLRRIATLLFLLVAGMLTVFGYYASSICITVVLAAFLAILFDPMVVKVEKLRLPRGVSAAVVVLAGMGLIGLLGHELYGRAATFAEGLPVYISKIQQTLEPISRKIQRVEQSAGNLTNEVQPSKKAPRFACRNREPGLLIWCAERGLYGSIDHCRRGSISNVFHALQQKANGHPAGCPLQFEDRHGSIHQEPERDDSRLRSRQPYRRVLHGRCNHIGLVEYWNERRDSFGNRQRALKSAAVPRTDLFA